MCYILRKNQKAMYRLLTTFSALHFLKIYLFIWLHQVLATCGKPGSLTRD